MTLVYLSLGSNIQPEANLPRAIDALRTYFAVLAISKVYQTAPQGFLEQSDFLNMAVGVNCPASISIEQVKNEIIPNIENQLGRVRDPNNKNAPRTIDIDISLWGDAILDYGTKPWHVPDADIMQFAHVAIPLADIAPDFVHPENKKPLAEIAGAFEHSAFIVRDDLGPF